MGYYVIDLHIFKTTTCTCWIRRDSSIGRASASRSTGRGFRSRHKFLYSRRYTGYLILKPNKLILTHILADSGGRPKRRFAATMSRFFAKMRPPCVFGANFGSRKRYVRSYARYVNCFWSSNQATSKFSTK